MGWAGETIGEMSWRDLGRGFTLGYRIAELKGLEIEG